MVETLAGTLAGTLYVRALHVDKVRLPRGLRLINRAVGTGVDVPDFVGALLDTFDTPQPLRVLDPLGREAGVIPESARPLIDNFILVPAGVRDILALGLLEPTTGAIAEPVLISEAGEHPQRMAVVGFPNAVGGHAPGTRRGPSIIREHFPWRGFRKPPDDADTAHYGLKDFDLRRRYRLPRYALDLGNVRIHTSEGLEAAGTRLSCVIQRLVEHALRPVVLGGNHAATLYAVEPLLARHDRLGIIHFDAHHDCYPDQHAVSHSNLFRRLLEHDGVCRVHQIGLRTVEEEFLPGQSSASPKLSYTSALEACTARDPAEVFADLDPALPYYLSFDVDCLAPQVAPETGTPVPGGLDFYTALRLVDHASRRFDIVGADFVEVSDYLGPEHGAGSAAARLLLQLLLGTVPYEPLDGRYLPQHGRTWFDDKRGA